MESTMTGRTSKHVITRALREPADQKCLASYHSSFIFFWRVIVFTLLIGPSVIYSGIHQLFRKRKDIKNEICLVTGTGRGLGRGIALELTRRGAFVVCADINEANNNETLRLIKENGGDAAGYTVNVCKAKEVTKMVEMVEREHGPIDILVNNAGLVMGVALDDWTPEEIISSYNVNVLSHYWTIKACIGSMKKRNKGHIVTMSSISAIVPLPYLTIYAATKAAIAALSNALREELELTEGNKIKLTTIYPFLVNTSADYSELYKLTVPVLSVAEAIRGIMDAILFEKYDAAIPSILYYFSRFLQLLPRNVYKLALRFSDAESYTPELDYRKNLPYYSIVSESINPLLDGRASDF